jgi:HTH-type transcriptional regulator, cell division transcriptional repressor
MARLCSESIFLSSIFPIMCLVVGKNIVGSRVRQARRTAMPLVTQGDLVARLQVQGIKIDQTGLSKLEAGKRPVTDTELVALAKALKVTTGWLLGETE